MNVTYFEIPQSSVKILILLDAINDNHAVSIYVCIHRLRSEWGGSHYNLKTLDGKGHKTKNADWEGHETR